MIKDRNIGYKYRFETFHASAMTCMGHLIGTEDGTADTLHAGNDANVTLTKFGTAGLVGWKLVADDIVRHILYAPTYIDFGNDVFFRVIWASGSTAQADTIDWLIKLGSRQPNLPPIVATFSPQKQIAQDTVDSSEVANIVQYTTWARMDGGTIAMDENTYMICDIELEAFAAGLSEDKGVLGLQIAYLPKFTSGSQVNDNADPTDVA